MFANVLTASIQGMEVCPVQVEADVSDGLPSFTMVGFPSAQVREAQDRVRTALKNNGIALPPRRITVNLAPADIRKEGAGFDMPVAAALLAAAGIFKPELLKGIMMAGEISLNGEIRGISGILPMVIKAREEGLRFCMIPWENLREGRLIEDIPVIGVKNLEEMIRFLKDPESFQNSREQEIVSERDETSNENMDSLDFSDIRGQESVRRAVEIAVSGFHNILLIGPPGAGKTMIARRIPTILPELTFEEGLELTKIYSISGLLSREQPFIKMRPFRSPHHTCSPQALAGGGKNPRPGEVTLAHRGVLFLDEMPEFSRRSLEILRQPLEDRNIHISRVNGNYEFPAGFILCAAMNPCPCGHYPDMNLCRCTAGEVAHYLGKISQPLLDRIDLCADVSPVGFAEISKCKRGECSADIRKRVEAVHLIQKERYHEEKYSFNGELKSSGVEKYCRMTPEASALLQKAFDTISLSARSYHRILKVARTIADMEGEEMIGSGHVAEALSYRAFDKKYWS